MEKRDATREAFLPPAHGDVTGPPTHVPMTSFPSVYAQAAFAVPVVLTPSTSARLEPSTSACLHTGSSKPRENSAELHLNSDTEARVYGQNILTTVPTNANVAIRSRSNARYMSGFERAMWMSMPSGPVSQESGADD